MGMKYGDTVRRAGDARTMIIIGLRETPDGEDAYCQWDEGEEWYPLSSLRRATQITLPERHPFAPR